MTTTQERSAPDVGTAGAAGGRQGRRGIIAGAAALAAGLLAREAVAPPRVAAQDGFAMIVGQGNTTSAQRDCSAITTPMAPSRCWM